MLNHSNFELFIVFITQSSTSLTPALNLLLIPLEPLFPQNLLPLLRKRSQSFRGTPNELHRFLHTTQPSPDSTQSFPRVNSRMRCGSPRENKRFIRKRDTSVRWREKELKVLFCLFGFRESSFLCTQTQQEAKEWYFYLFIFLYTTPTRTIFLAYKRTITEESNKKSWFKVCFFIHPSPRVHVLLFCSTLKYFNKCHFLFLFYLYSFRPSPFQLCAIFAPPPLFCRKRCLSQSEQKFKIT